MSGSDTELTAVTFAGEAPRVIQSPPQENRKVTERWRWALAGSSLLLALHALAFAARRFPDAFDRALFTEILERAAPILHDAVRSPLSGAIGLAAGQSLAGLLLVAAGLVLLLTWLQPRAIPVFGGWLAAVAALLAGGWTVALVRAELVSVAPWAVGLMALLGLAYAATAIGVFNATLRTAAPARVDSKLDRWVIRLGVVAALASPWIGRSYWGEPFQALGHEVPAAKADIWRLNSPIPEGGWVPFVIGGVAIAALVTGLLLLRPPFRGRGHRLGQGAVLALVGATVLLSGWPSDAAASSADQLARDFHVEQPSDADLGAYCSWWTRGMPARTIEFEDSSCNRVVVWRGQQIQHSFTVPFGLRPSGGMETGSYSSTVVAAGPSGIIGIDWTTGQTAWTRECDRVRDVLFSGSADPHDDDHRRTEPLPDGRTEYVRWECDGATRLLDPATGADL